MAAAGDEFDRQAVAHMALACLDLTDLGEETTEAATLSLCDKAVTPHGPVAAICIWPRFVAAARDHLGPLHPVRIATVVNFPSGGLPIDSVVGETVGAIADGADEIDLVIPYGALKAGDAGAVRDMVSVIRASTPKPARLKTILETGELGEAALIRQAADIALANGADFIKSSTGKVAVNATLEAAETMLTATRENRSEAGFKPAGGIRSVDDAAAYFALARRIMGRGWVSPCSFRFGASGLLADILATLDGKDAAKPGDGY